jgi:PAS domain S-box-containing protein
MTATPEMTSETQRLRALRAHRILDTPPEAAFDALVTLAASQCGTTAAAVALVDAGRVWFKASVGLGETGETGETPREFACCAHALFEPQWLEVFDADTDARFSAHPLVDGPARLRFYAGAPLVDAAGFTHGVLCVFDREPRRLSDAQRQALTALATVATGLIEARHQADLQRILDTMPALITYWDRNLCNRFCNAAYLDWLGLTPEQVYGQAAPDLIGHDLYRANLPQMKAALQGKPQQFERTLLLRDGSTTRALLSYLPDIVQGDVQGFYVLAHDIGPLHEEKTARANAEAYLECIIDSASEFAILATDLAGTITLFSRGAERMLGYSAKDVIGQLGLTHFHLDAEIASRARVLSELAGQAVDGFDVLAGQARLGMADAGEWTWRRADGSRLPVQLVVSGVRGMTGEMIGYVGIARDIAAQQQQQVALAQARDTAQTASHARNLLVSNMSHELRTPLSAIQGAAQLLANSPLNAAQRQYADIIQEGGRTLLAILNDVLDFSKIEAGQMELENKTFFLEDILKAVASVMALANGGKELELAIQVDPDLPTALEGDGLRLQQIFTNLIGNAVKFTDHGEVALILRRGPAHERGIMLGVEIVDTGIALDPDEQAGLLSGAGADMTPAARRFGGVGLGLAISQQLVAMMGGRITLDSRPGAGSRFHFELPFGLSPHGAPKRFLPSFGPLRVLVGDDSATGVAALRGLITAWGWQAECVATLPEAQARYLDAQRGSTPFDLVILNRKIDGEDSADCVQLVKSHPAATPVILLTPPGAIAHAAPADGRPMPDATLIKPVTASALFDVVLDVCAKAHSPAAEPDAARGGNIALSGVRILLVEDNPMNQIVARGLLEQAGASIAIAGDGQQAIDMIERQPRAFDIVLMDVQMPVLDGFQATRHLRQALRSTVPVVALTASVMPEEREQCYEAGMDDFIPKPIDRAHMVRVILRNLPARLNEPLPFDRTETLDIGAILDMFPDDEDFRRQVAVMLQRLREIGPAMIADVDAAWRAGRVEQAQQALHKARGGIGTLGARRLAALTLEIEHAMEEGRLTEAEEALPQLEREMADVLRVLDEWLRLEAARTHPASGTPA